MSTAPNPSLQSYPPSYFGLREAVIDAPAGVPPLVTANSLPALRQRSRLRGLVLFLASGGLLALLLLGFTAPFSPYSWVLLAILGAAAQTLRNATQNSLTSQIGATGATYVRFVYGSPFVLAFLAIALCTQHGGIHIPNYEFWIWALAASFAQTIGTILMLKAMSIRVFSVATSYVKTESLFLALFASSILHERLTVTSWIGVAVATAGVVLISIKPSKEALNLGSFVYGISAAIVFAVTSLGFRGTIQHATFETSFVNATFSLFAVMGFQNVLLTLFLSCFQRATLMQTFSAWKESLLAGASGAFASGFLFFAYALANVASVRTVTLVEVIFSQAVSFFVLGQRTTKKEIAGITVIVVGVGLVLLGH